MKKGWNSFHVLDPPGICRQGSARSLLIQTRRSRKAPAKTEACWRSIMKTSSRGNAEIQASLALSEAGLQAIRDFLKTLSLQPAGQITQEEVYIRPDVEIYCDEKGQLALRSLEEIPDVYFRDDLYDQYAAQGDKETLAYIRKARRDFNDLASALAYRHHSIEQVVTCLMSHQKDYFLYHKPCSPCGRRTSPRRRNSARLRSAASATTATSSLKARYIHCSPFWLRPMPSIKKMGPAYPIKLSCGKLRISSKAKIRTTPIRTRTWPNILPPPRFP